MPIGPPGCWTCRVRHRKCDLETPSCKECTDRHVHCHGYGPKPAWMDGGPEEEKERARIKAAINQNFRHVKKIQSRARRSRSVKERTEPDTPASEAIEATDGTRNNTAITPPHLSASPSLPEPTESVTPSPCGAESPGILIHTDEQGDSRVDDVAVESCRGPSQTNFNSNIFGDQEACLLMHYLDQVFQWQFPYHDSRSRLGNRGWLFLLLIKRGPLYHAILSLSSLHHSALLGTEEEFQRKQKALDHHSRALRELCDLMSENGDKLRDDHGQLAEFLACSFMLISFQVFSGAEHDWLLHLDAVTSVMSLLSPEAIFNADPHAYGAHLTSIGSSFYDRRGSLQGLEFLMVTVVWFDLFASLSTGRAPRLPYQDWLCTPGLNTADLMGCQNWVMVIIGDLANFSIWKERQENDGLLSIRELARKGQEIETRLENGIQNLDLSKGYTEPELLSNWVSRIFALACLVLLHTIVSGPLPGLPEVQSAVARSIAALQSRPKHYSLTGLVWALCVIGCMAQPHSRSFFENLMAELVRGAGRCGNSETVWKIIKKCWEMQDTARVDSRATMAEMGIHAILI